MVKVRLKDLENGVQAPGNSKYYGTNELGQIGMHQVPGAISSLGTKTLAVYGEAIGAGKPAFFGKGNYINTEKVDIINDIGSSGNINFGYTTAIRTQQPFYVGKYNIMKTFSLRIMKVGSPTDNVSLLIYDTDRTTLIATLTKFTQMDTSAYKQPTTPLTGSIIATGYLTYDFIADNLQLQSYKTYYMEIRRSDVPSATNYYATSYYNSQSYKYNIRGQCETYNGTTWDRVFQSDEGALRYSIQYGMLCEAGKVYACNSDFMEKAMTECITEEAKLATETGLVTLSGVNTNFTKLVKGKRYNLANYTYGGEQKTNYNTTDHFGYATTDNEKSAQSFVLSKTTTISKLMLSLLKVGSPTDDVIVRIETNNPLSPEATQTEHWYTSGVPSGTLAHANATFTVPYHRLYTYNYMNVRDFNGQFDLVAGEVYWIVLTRSGALNTSNYYSTSIQNTNVYGRGNYKQYENLAWTNQGWDMVFNFCTNIQEMGQYNAINDTTMYIGYDTDTHYAHAQTFMVSKPTSIDSVQLRLMKMGTPTQGVKVRIEGNKKCDLASATNLYKNTSGNAWKAFGNTTIKRLAMKFKGTENLSARFLSLYFQKTLSPTDNVRVRIETDNAGAPSGTLVSASAVATFDPTYVGTGGAFYAQFDFGTPVPMLSNIDYWIVIDRTGTDSATNYYNVYYQDNVYANGAMSTSVDGIVWITTVNDLRFYFSHTSYEGGYEPDGQLIDPSATAVVSAATIALSYNRRYKFQFASSVILMPNTLYRLVVEPEQRTESTSNYYRLRGNNVNAAPFQFRYKKQHKHTNYWTSNNNDRRFRRSFQNRMEPLEGEIGLNPGAYYGSSILAVSDVNAMFTKTPIGKNNLCGKMAVSTTYYFLAVTDGIFFMYDGMGVNSTTMTIREYLDSGMLTETENFDLSIGAMAFATTYSFPMVAGRYYKIVTPVTYAPKYRLLSV